MFEHLQRPDRHCGRSPWAVRVIALVAGCVLFSSGAARAQTAGVMVTPTALNVSDGGTNDYSVKLVNKQPTASVTITVSKSSGGDADLSVDTDTTTTGNQNTLTFTTSNWNTAQTVTVTAAQDTDMAAGTATFTHAATSTDTDYNGIAIASVTATEFDDEAGICPRTEAVRDALVAAISGAATCADVTSAQLAALTTVNLSNRNIVSLRASDFDGLTKVERLELDENSRLSEVPSVSRLTALKRLDVSDNALISLPDLGQNTALTHLDAERNVVRSLPDLSRNTALTHLNLGNQRGLSQEYGLTSLPDLSRNTALTHLNVWNNLLTSLPDLSHLTALESLNVAANRLTSLRDLSQNTALTHLNVSGNRLTSLPSLSNLNALTDLRVSRNRLTSLPDLSQLTALSQLDVAGNRLTSLPDLNQLTALTVLWAGTNRLTELPADLSQLTALTELAVQNNRLTSLPDLSQLTALKWFYAGNNRLTSLWDLSQNTGLRGIHVQNNRLTSLPDLSQLTALWRLWANGNRLTSLPDLSQLTNLTTLFLHDNPLSNLSALTVTDAGGNAVALTRPFSGHAIAHTASVEGDLNSVTVTPTAADTGVMPSALSTTFPAPTIQVGPRGSTLTPVTSGSASGPITLNVGSNAIDVEVSGRAAVGSRAGARGTRTYRLTVWRGPVTFSVAPGSDDDIPGSQLLFIADTGIDVRNPAGSGTPDSRSVSDRLGTTEAAQKNFISVANTAEDRAVTVLFQYHNDEMRRVLWYLRVLRAGATVLVDPFDHEIPGTADGAGGSVNVKGILFGETPSLSSEEKAGFNSGRFVIGVTAVGANTVDDPGTDGNEGNTLETANILFPTFLAKDLHGMDNIDNCGELKTTAGATEKDDNLEYTRHGADGADDCSRASDAAGRDETSRNVGGLSVHNYQPLAFNHLTGHHTAARILPELGEGTAWGVNALTRPAITTPDGADAETPWIGTLPYTVLDGANGARLAPKVHGGAEEVNAATDDDNRADDSGGGGPVARDPTPSENNRVVNGGALVWPALHRTAHGEQQVRFLSVADEYGDPGGYRLLAARTLYRIELHDALGNVLADADLQLPVFGGLPVPDPPPSLFLLVDGIGVRPDASPADCTGNDRVEGWRLADLTDLVSTASMGGEDFAGLDAPVDLQANASPGWVEFHRTQVTCTRDYGDGDPSDNTTIEVPDGIPTQDQRSFIGGTLVVEKETANRTFVTAGQVVVRFLTPDSAFAASWWLSGN